MNWQTVSNRDFTGGENLALLPEAIPRNCMIKAENVLISPEGLLTDSFQLDTNVASNLGTGAVFGRPNIAGQYPCWQHYAGDAAGIIRSYTVVLNGVNDLSAGVQHNTSVTVPAPDFSGLTFSTQYLKKEYAPSKNGGIVNLTDYTVIYNGALIDRPVVKLRQYDNRLWGVTTDGALIFSDNGDATTWDALNIILLPNQEKAIDFIPVLGGVIVYSRSSIYNMYGSGTYQDTSLVRIKDDSTSSMMMFAEGAVEVDNTVYILSNRGIIATALNGSQELPHNQNSFFKANYPVWNTLLTGFVNGVYLYKFHAILYVFQTGSATQSFLYYIKTGSFFKLNTTLVHAYILALPDPSHDFLFKSAAGFIGKSIYPSGVLSAAKQATIRLRHEDFGSQRAKVFRELIIDAGGASIGTTINAYLDYSATPVVIASNKTLTAGENTIYLDGLRGKTLSLEFVMNHSIAQNASFSIRGLGMKYREAGA